MHGTRAGWRGRTMVVAFGVAAVIAHAAPFVPTDDAQVLERLPDRTSTQYRDLKRLQALAAASPADPAKATALADAYYRISRAEGDPRFLGYAQAALLPWWKDPEAPTPILITRASILQSNHEFTRALADLDRVLAREPRNGRARLVRATVLTVQGKFTGARTDCQRLEGVAPAMYGVACLASIDSVTGKSAAAVASIERAMAELPDITPDGRAWVESLLGEIGHRRGDATAEAHFRAALAADSSDLYTIGAYSDWLLDNNRPGDVAALVQTHARVDALLLRLALAQKALRLPEADATIATLRARFAASRARGDVVHRREEARFQLQLNGDPHAALQLAADNWNVQHEPADLRILAEAAAATMDSAAQSTVRSWLSETGLEYPRVTALANARARAER